MESLGCWLDSEERPTRNIGRRYDSEAEVVSSHEVGGNEKLREKLWSQVLKNCEFFICTHPSHSAHDRLMRLELAHGAKAKTTAVIDVRPTQLG